MSTHRSQTLAFSTMIIIIIIYCATIAMRCKHERSYSNKEKMDENNVNLIYLSIFLSAMSIDIAIAIVFPSPNFIKFISNGAFNSTYKRFCSYQAKLFLLSNRILYVYEIFRLLRLIWSSCDMRNVAKPFSTAQQNTFADVIDGNEQRESMKLLIVEYRLMDAFEFILLNAFYFSPFSRSHVLIL